MKYWNNNVCVLLHFDNTREERERERVEREKMREKEDNNVERSGE